MKKIVLLVGFISFCSISLAQDYYRRGYIITLENKIVEGLINDKEWKYNPQLVEFKENENATPKVYRTQEIRAFTTTRGVYYESHHFKYDGDLLNTGATASGTNYATTRTPVKWIEDDYFLEVLVLGKFSLFKFTDQADRVHFFLLEKDKKELEELQYRMYLTKIEGANTVSTNENYKQQLINYSQELCPDLKSKILKCAYETGPLSRLLQSINKCFNDEQEVPVLIAKPAEIVKPKIGIVAYVYMGKTENSKFSYDGFNKILFSGGLTLEVFSKKRPNRTSFYNELKLKVVNESGLSAFSYTPGTLKFKSIKATSLFRFYAKDSKWFYFTAGANYGFRFDNELIVGLYNPVYDSEFEFGPAVGIGFKIRPIKASIELRGEYDFPVKFGSDFKSSKAIGIAINKQFY